MVAKTDQERLDAVKRIHDAVLNLWVRGHDRLLSLTASTLELVSDGKRNGEEIVIVLQAIKDGKKFRKSSEAMLPPDVNVQNQLVQWQSRYLGIGIKKDFSDLRIPEKPEGFNRLIVVVKELKISKLITELKKKMNFWIYTNLQNLDKVKDIVQRPDGDYAIWVRDRQEADEELKNKSANDIQEEGLNTETLKERILHGWAHFEETGKHLDEKSWTICVGSRDSGGDVPSVDWYPGRGEVCVGWFRSGCRSSLVRARQAVS